MRDWQGIVIHHSAGTDVSANTIDEWHKERGFINIGYHFVVRKNGNIEPSRSFSKAGAHALGRNATHIGICLTGHFGKEPPTNIQLDAALLLVKGCMERFGIAADSVEQHHEECPGALFPWKKFKEELI